MSEVTTDTPLDDAFSPSRPSQNRRNPQKLFDDPAAQAVWVALLTLDVAVQHEFLARLRERLAVPTLYDGADVSRTARLVAAVREAEDMLVSQAAEREDFDPARRRDWQRTPTRAWAALIATTVGRPLPRCATGSRAAGTMCCAARCLHLSRVAMRC